MKETKIFYDAQILQGMEGDQEWVSTYGLFEDSQDAIDLSNDMQENHPHEKFRVVEWEVVSTIKRVLQETP